MARSSIPLPPDAERIFDAPVTCPPLTQVRSTLLVASLATIRRLGHFDAYRGALAEEHASAILDAVAGTWIPLAHAMAHYDACDALQLSDDQLVNIGRTVGEKLQGTLTGAAARLSKSAGVTPWTLFAQFPRFWARLFEGSAVVGWKLGPKEARLDVLKMPLCSSRYFRTALRGQAMVVPDLFCTKSYMSERPSPSPGTWTFRVQWA